MTPATAAPTLTRWNHLIVLGQTAEPSAGQREVDLYLSAFNGRLPTAEDADLRAETVGPDYLNINAEDDFFIQRRPLLQLGP